MLNSELINCFNTELSAFFGESIEIASAEVVHGGSINDTYHLKSKNQSFMLKLNQNQNDDFFSKEASGLKVLRDSSSLKIPQVYAVKNHENWQFLLMEYIQEGKPNNESWASLGRDLAQLHKNTNKHFGWKHNNYIGSLPQPNNTKESWIEFFIESRLQYQAKLAHDQNLLSDSLMSQLEQLYQKLSAIIPNEQPALLHGDLWSGNHLIGQSNRNVLIDPAVYYGHREVDIAMMHLFGGFPKIVFESYNEVFPFEKEWEQRIDLFNLYPLLVHVNLFGSSYSNRVTQVLNKYLK